MFKQGLAKSIHHARVLIKQRHIRVGKQVVNVPSFMVRLDSEKHAEARRRALRPGLLPRRAQAAAASAAGGGGDGGESRTKYFDGAKPTLSSSLLLDFASHAIPPILRHGTGSVPPAVIDTTVFFHHANLIRLWSTVR